jgi:hypothetical protein
LATIIEPHKLPSSSVHSNKIERGVGHLGGEVDTVGMQPEDFQAHRVLMRDGRGLPRPARSWERGRWGSVTSPALAPSCPLAPHTRIAPPLPPGWRARPLCRVCRACLGPSRSVVVLCGLGRSVRRSGVPVDVRGGDRTISQNLGRKSRRRSHRAILPARRGGGAGGTRASAAPRRPAARRRAKAKCSKPPRLHDDDGDYSCRTESPRHAATAGTTARGACAAREGLSCER